MDWWEYLHPDTVVSSQIVSALNWGFLAWGGSLLAKLFHLLYEGSQMSRLSHARPLQERLDEHIHKQDKTVEPPNARGEADEADEAFDDFCRGAGVRHRSVIAGHVRAIFASGWENSQLQADSLVKNTANRLFRFNGVLRSVLSLFIIVGLLGTLFGLAASLAQLSPLMTNTQQQLNTQVGEGLRDLLSQLRGAFAPSIWGVLFTVMGVLIFSAYSYFCNYLKDRLGHLTHTIWLPRLSPSPFQRQFTSLLQTGEMIEKNRESVELVAAVAADIKSDMGGLRHSIGGARRTLTELSETSTRITDFAGKFHEGVLKLVPFQEQLHELYVKMLSDSAAFQESVRRSVDESSSFQHRAGELLLRQGEKIEEILRALNSYESAYIDARHDIDTKLVTVLDEARKAYEQIGERNEEISRAIKDSLSDPLRQDLTLKLGEVHEVLGDKLGRILDKFGTFAVPIEGASVKIERIASTIDRRATELTTRLRQEYLEQTRLNKQQLDGLEALDRNLATLLIELTEVSKTQGVSASSIQGTVETLTRSLDSLRESLGALNLSPAASDGAAKAEDIARVEKQAGANTLQILREISDLKRMTVESARSSQQSRGGDALGGKMMPGQSTQRAQRHAPPAANEPAAAEEQPSSKRSDEPQTSQAGGVDTEGGVVEAKVATPQPEIEGAVRQEELEAGAEPPRPEREQKVVAWTGVSTADNGRDSWIRTVYGRVRDSLRGWFGRG
jgi:biopolymer transport protein ExbB/TolQ